MNYCYVTVLRANYFRLLLEHQHHAADVEDTDTESFCSEESRVRKNKILPPNSLETSGEALIHVPLPVSGYKMQPGAL